MRVLYYHQHFSTPEGSTGTRSYEMSRRLLARGHQVTMVCGSYKGGRTGLSGPFAKGMRRGQVDGIEVIELALDYANAHSFTRRLATFLRFAARGAAIALREPYDLVFATSTPLTAGIPGILARALRAKPMVFEVRDLWPELPRAMGVITNPVVLTLMSGLEWLSYHAARHVIALSPGMAAGVARRGIAPARITTVSNGCDTALFDAVEERWRPEGVAAEEFMAVYSGTFGLANGLEAVLAAAAELKRRQRPDIKLVLIGDGMRRAALAAEVARQQLDNVVLLAPVAKTRLAGLLKAADLGLQILANVPAFYDGTSPNKFFDYLACGLPVLINYPGWLATFVTERRLGFAVPPGDAAGFATALISAADDRADSRQRGQAARRLAEAEFSRDALANRWVSVLEQAWNEGRS